MSTLAASRLGLPGPDCAFFFDIDGTLAEIASDPAAASVDPELQARVSALSKATGGALALVSGRSIATVDALFPGTRMPVAGQHGAERRRASGIIVRHGLPVRCASRLRARLAAAVRVHPGLYFEDKGEALALHYRHALGLAGFAHRLMRSLATECGPTVTVRSGKMVAELLVSRADKGRAVRAFMRESPFRDRRPIFVGDDRTDEAAFSVVNDLDGCTVKVGPGRTVARWRLRHVTDVKRWLASDIEATPAGKSSRPTSHHDLP